MRAVLTVVGHDRVGILARISGECAAYNVNVSDVSQTVLQDMFCMMMICDTSGLSVSFGDFCDHMSKIGEEIGMSVRVMHEDIFNSMHRV